MNKLSVSTARLVLILEFTADTFTSIRKRILKTKIKNSQKKIIKLQKNLLLSFCLDRFFWPP